MRLDTFRSLYLTQLREIYDAEQQIQQALPVMARAATQPALRTAFEQHQKETERQIHRLSKLFKQLGQRPEGETSEAMVGLISDGNKLMQSGGEEAVMDAGLISAAQKIEHYEMAAYGTAIAYAHQLGDHAAAKILRTTLKEEQATDKKLSQLAEKRVNVHASRFADYSGEHEYDAYSPDGFSATKLLVGTVATVAVGALVFSLLGLDTRKQLAAKAGAFIGNVDKQQWDDILSSVVNQVRRYTR